MHPAAIGVTQFPLDRRHLAPPSSTLIEIFIRASVSSGISFATPAGQQHPV
jgi:hypothetical protein